MILNSLQTAARAAAPMIADHLWQSTLFALIAWAGTLAFNRNHARLRFGLWLAASVKFLIPFSMLIALGSHLARPHESASEPLGIYSVVAQASQPFSSTAAPGVAQVAPRANPGSHLPAMFAIVWLCGSVAVVGLWWARWRHISLALRGASPGAEGREVEALRQLEAISGVRRPIPLLVSRDSMEPGIFGIVRPVLLWPEGISEHLDDAQLRAILAHELWHVRRRDNLAAALHMLIEAAFWFHPLVWWIGSRLVEERERACDEEVLRLGSHPAVYAESILKACRFCVESPLSCVSGVSGSDLKRRIVRIMNQQIGNRLGLGGRALLATLAIATVAIPVGIGISNPRQAQAEEPKAAAAPLPEFDVLSVKPSTAASDVHQVEMAPDHFSEINATVKSLIEFGYGVKEYQLIGAPEWIGADKFDVEARWKAPAGLAGPGPGPVIAPDEGPGMVMMPPGGGAPLAPPPPGGHATFTRMGVTGGKARMDLAQAMVQKLLKERFNLSLRRESRDLPVYALVQAGTGVKLAEAPPTPRPPTANGKPMSTFKVMLDDAMGEMDLRSGSTAELAAFLSRQVERNVVDKTGLTGRYQISLRWHHDENIADAISTALEEQLGLRLESQQAPVEVLIVDQVDRPTEN